MIVRINVRMSKIMCSQKKADVCTYAAYAKCSSLKSFFPDYIVVMKINVFLSVTSKCFADARFFSYF